MQANRRHRPGRTLEDMLPPGCVDDAEPADADDPGGDRGEQHDVLLTRRLRGDNPLPGKDFDHAEGSAAAPSGDGCPRSWSSRCTSGLMPAACSRAASSDCATLAVTVTPTSGCSMTRTRCMPNVLIGRSRTIWLRSTVKPAAVTASEMSRAMTEP